MAVEDLESNDLEHMGPVDYVLIEFPDGVHKGDAAPLLIDLVDRGIIRILDFLFVRKETDGSVTALTVADLDGDGEVDVRIVAGTSSGLLDDADVADAASVIEPGSSGGIMIFENTWAAPFVSAIRAGGAQVVATGRIPHDQVMSTLERVGGATR